MTNAVTLASLANSGYLRNRIINGAMAISQRNGIGAVNVSSDSYTLDRWLNRVSGGGVITNQQSSSVVPANFSYSAALTVQTADSSIAATDVYDFEQRIEGFNTADLGWGTSAALPVTLSFWVRSSVTGTYGVGLQSASYTRSYVATYTINSANTWEYKTITVPGDTGGTQNNSNGLGVGVCFDLGSGSNCNATAGSWGAGGGLWRTSGCVNWIANSGATFYITGVQLEVGTQATPFEWRQYTTELQLCQRYYEKSHLPSIVPGTDNLSVTDTGFYVIYGDGGTAFSWRVDKRAVPTSTVQAPLTTSSNNKIRQASNGTILTVSSITVYGNVANIAASGAANAYYYQIGWTATAEL